MRAAIPDWMQLDYALFYVTMVLIFMSDIVSARKLSAVHWNSTNPMFKTSNNEHVIEVSLYDEVDIICPLSAGTSFDAHEYYVIYQVSREEYEDCNIYSHSAAILIVNCSNPTQRRRFTLLFEPFSAIPHAPEYHPGGTYYFISTSTGDLDGLSNRRQGACYANNMKLTFQVCCESTTTSPSTNSTPVASTGIAPNSSSPSEHASTLAPPSSTATTTTSTTTTASTPVSTTLLRTMSQALTTPPVRFTDKPPDKNKGEGNNGENEVTDPKKEGLVNSATRPFSNTTVLLLYVVSLVTTLHQLLER